MKKRYYSLLLILSIILIKSLFFNKVTVPSLAHYSANWNYPVQVALHDLYLPKEKVNIVMLGDSHTYRANWNELLEDNSIVNRGIDGDTSAGFLGRLDSILKLEPQYIYLLGGYNDFRKGYEVKKVFSNIKLILKKIKEKNMIPILYATLYDSEGYYEDKIYQLNLFFEEYCKINNIKFIDLNQKLSYNRRLLKKYSYDGVHLNVEGYSVWKELFYYE